MWVVKKVSMNRESNIIEILSQLIKNTSLEINEKIEYNSLKTDAQFEKINKDLSREIKDSSDRLNMRIGKVEETVNFINNKLDQKIKKVREYAQNIEESINKRCDKTESKVDSVSCKVGNLGKSVIEIKDKNLALENKIYEVKKT